MECSEPGAIRDDELIAYLAGEQVRPAVVQHLARCQHCSAQLASYQRMEHKLISKLYRWDCPSNQILGEYQLGLLSNEQATEVKHHLSTCVLCTAEMATLTEFLAHDPMLVDRTPAPQQNMQPALTSVQHAKRALDQLREEVQASTRRIIATFLPPQPRLAYQRDVAHQPSPWPRRYSAEDVSVSLQLEQSPARKDSLQLIGFVTRKGVTLESLQGIPVQLSSPDHTVYAQNIDELGNFVFSSITPATYMLELQFPELVVVIDQLPVTSQD